MAKKLKEEWLATKMEIRIVGNIKEETNSWQQNVQKNSLQNEEEWLANREKN